MSTISWDDAKRQADAQRRAAGMPVRTEPERATAVNRLRAEVRAWQLAEIRREQQLTQKDLAGYMGVSGPRVSAIEHGNVDRTEIATLRSYIESLGGDLRVTADFGDTTYRVA